MSIMHFSGRLRVGLCVLIVLTVVQGVASAQGVVGPANEHFQRVWDRTDRPVAEDIVDRTWMWGPALGEARVERYDNAEGGERIVQYFDKSRMEINDPSGDPASPWFVTNGLLAVELISGQMQVADHEYETRLPAEINVAGDQGFQNGPTYATFSKFLDRYIWPDQSYDRGDALVIERIDRSGIETTDESLAAQGVRLAHYDDVTKYNVAEPFWTFMHSSGTIYENGTYQEGPLVENAIYATGRPIMEPYWSDVVVDGVERLVLIQCFERRCLTYTPDNPDGWKVEAGNIGQHYFQWRYTETPEIDGEILFFRNRQLPDGTGWETDLYLVNADGSGLRNLTAELDISVDDAVWSPDGRMIALVGEGDLYVLRVDITTIEQITVGEAVDVAPDWSPDGEELAFEREENGRSNIFTIAVNGAGPRQITDVSSLAEATGVAQPDWSPDGESIAFVVEYPNQAGVCRSGLAIAPASGGEIWEIVPPDSCYIEPMWSPDGEQILYQRPALAGRDVLQGAVHVVAVREGEASSRIVVGADYTSPGRPTWSPDGSHLAISLRPARLTPLAMGTRGLHLVDPETSERAQITHFGGDPSWSPDGTYLAFSFGYPQRSVGITNLSGTELWVVTDDGWFPQWRPWSGG